jgi:hypothetical protein
MSRIHLTRCFAWAIAAGLIFAGSSRAEIAEGLVSYWPLDGNFTDVVGQNDGILVGSNQNPVFEAGRFNNGIVLDGIDQFIEIQGDESDFDFVGQDFSVSAWFSVDAFDKSWQALIAKGEGNRWRVHRRDAGSILTWNGGSADVPEGTNPSIDDGALHHFVGVSTVDEVLMYMNGELVAVGPAPNVENNDQPVMIGENPDARGRTWNGMIDDVAIWGRALDESEVAFLWNNGNGRTPLDPGAIAPLFIGGENTIGTRQFEGSRSNPVFGEEQVTGGLTGRIVTFADHGVQLDDHTIAEEMLEDFDGTTRSEAYTVADLGGGNGSFAGAQPYPNGVADESMNDFAVQLTANVKIPAGTWTIGFGSDDGGQVTIPGIEFQDFLNSDSFEDDQIRFTGNRGHAWTVGTFELAADLETTIVASFHERGGGDSFEIAVIDEEALEAASPGAGWQLLGDGALGWEVKTTAAPLLSADLTATFTSARAIQFDVNGDTGAADQLVVENPDPNVFTTILNVDGLTFQIKSTGSVSDGEAFVIANADQVVGNVTVTSVTAGQTWIWDGANGRVCLTTCPPIGGGSGDFNGNGVLDAGDLDLQAAAMAGGAHPAAFDLNSDGLVNFADREQWVNVLKNTYMGDANLDGEFSSADFVAVFVAGKYETGTAAGWAEGDWNGDGVFSSGDFVTAFSGGGYENGPRTGVSAVPEPASVTMLALGLLALVGARRRR